MAQAPAVFIENFRVHRKILSEYFLYRFAQPDPWKYPIVCGSISGPDPASTDYVKDVVPHNPRHSVSEPDLEICNGLNAWSNNPRVMGLPEYSTGSLRKPRFQHQQRYSQLPSQIIPCCSRSTRIRHSSIPILCRPLRMRPVPV